MEEDKKYYCSNCHTIQGYSQSDKCVICKSRCELIMIDGEKISHKKKSIFLWLITFILCVFIILLASLLPFFSWKDQFEIIGLSFGFFLMIPLIILLPIIIHEKLALRPIRTRTDQEVDNKVNELELKKKEDNEEYQKRYL